MSKRCPCCGQEVDDVKLQMLRDLDLPAVPSRIISALCDVYPRGLLSSQLIERVYAGAKEPDYAATGISIQVGLLRSRLEPYGWTIPKGHAGKGNLAVYKLVKLGA